MTAFLQESHAQRIVFGTGRLAEIGGEVERLAASRIFVIASPASKAVGDEIAERLSDRIVARHEDVAQHVPVDLADRARRVAADSRADLVVTVGGGSSVGLGKAVVLEHDALLLAVPTTYAGSEMTPIYGITGEHKRTGRDPRVVPRTVIYDPGLTLGLPSRITAATGMNAIAHCVEAFYADAATPLAALLAEEGIRKLAGALPRAVDDPGSLDARTEALFGAYLAGSALAVAGTGMHHKLCHVLGGSFGLAHGDMNAVVLPHVVSFNAPAIPGALARMGRALATDDVAGALWDLARRLDAPASLADLGLPEDAIPEAAQRAAGSIGPNPRSYDEGDIRTLVEMAHVGGRPSS